MHLSSIDTHFFIFGPRLMIWFHFPTVLDILGEPGARSSSNLRLVSNLFVIFLLRFSGTTFFLPFPMLRCIFLVHSNLITVTNYTGEAREYLKKLISAIGATFTLSMSG